MKIDKKASMEAISLYKDEVKENLDRIDPTRFKRVTGLEITTRDKGLVVSKEYFKLYADGVITGRYKRKLGSTIVDCVDFQIFEVNPLHDDEELIRDRGIICDICSEEFTAPVLKDGIEILDQSPSQYALIDGYLWFTLPSGIDWREVARYTGVTVLGYIGFDEEDSKEDDEYYDIDYELLGIRARINGVEFVFFDYELIKNTTNQKYYIVMTVPSPKESLRLDGSLVGDTRYLASLELPENCMSLDEIHEDIKYLTNEQFEALF